MKVTMLVDTYYGRPVKAQDELDVPEDVARRWQKNRIARIDESYTPGDKPIERMSVAELNELAESLGLSVDKSVKKADLIEMINDEKNRTKRWGKP